MIKIFEANLWFSGGNFKSKIGENKSPRQGNSIKNVKLNMVRL